MITDSVVLLGSTGSIGRQTLEVAEKLGIKIEALATGSNVKLLEEQIRRFKPSLCAVRDEAAAAKLKFAVADTPVKIFAGADGARNIVAESKSSRVLNAIIGFAGLSATLEAIERGKELLLANKESLVAAGELVIRRAEERGVKILPVDSEHCAIHQCLDGKNTPSRLILTASGGPFFGMKREELSKLTARDALRHPTWSMGAKITIDSATLMNKGFEVIEAARLFDLPAEKIDVVVHRQSIIHSMVEYNDGAVIAQLSRPDMRMCIQYALTYPKRIHGLTEALDFTKLSALTFDPPDTVSFPLLTLAYDAYKRGGIIPAAMNAANEAAVDLFLHDKIGFNDISDLVREVTNSTPFAPCLSLSDACNADAEARERINILAAV